METVGVEEASERRVARQISGLRSYIQGLLQVAVWRSRRSLAEHLYIESAMIVVPFLVSLGWWMTDRWITPTPDATTQALPTLIAGVIAAAVALVLIVVSTLVWNLLWAPVNIARAGGAQLDELIQRMDTLEEGGPQQLIRVTPNQGSNLTPTGQGDVTVWELDAYLDVETIDQSRPLRDCRIKLLELEHFETWIHKEKGKEAVIERWARDPFYQGQTYFFSWSGRPAAVDAVDVHSSERASIAKCAGVRPELTTTAGTVGYLFLGDQYHLTVEITADNSLPLTKEYWLQMIGGHQTIIEDWAANPRSGLGTADSQP